MVPSERAALSKSKRRGEVKQYIEEIEADDSRKAERWWVMLSDMLSSASCSESCIHTGQRMDSHGRQSCTSVDGT